MGRKLFEEKYKELIQNIFCEIKPDVCCFQNCDSTILKMLHTNINVTEKYDIISSIDHETNNFFRIITKKELNFHTVSKFTFGLPSTPNYENRLLGVINDSILIINTSFTNPKVNIKFSEIFNKVFKSHQLCIICGYFDDVSLITAENLNEMCYDDNKITIFNKLRLPENIDKKLLNINERDVKIMYINIS